MCQSRRCSIWQAAAGVVIAIACLSGFLVQPVIGDDGETLLRIDHYVRVKSSVPAIAGQAAQIYVRERAKAGTVLRSPALADRVVLFIHGAGTPADVSFDAPYQDYSWMGYLANAGFDTFSMDLTGYGRSTRPAPMSDPCNLAAAQQATFIPSLLSAPCAPSYPYQLTTMPSDWDDVGAVVDYVRTLRRVDKVSLVSWSLGGPRAAGYAGQHPEKIHKLVLLAPAYNRTATATPPAKIPVDGVPMNTQTRGEFNANWDRQVGCANQFDPAIRDTIWSKMLESDPVGATWGPGVRRAPQTTNFGWTQTMVAKTQIPTLMITGVHDKQVLPERVRELYADLGAPQKVFIDLGCSSHMAMWENKKDLMFRASLEWLTQGTVEGKKEGMMQLGY
jgi:pimeloyl-ACP methyl ester carboxylesterase